MKGLDTTALIDALRGEEGIRKKVAVFDQAGLATTEVNAFETLVGFHFQGGSALSRRLDAVYRLLEDLVVFPLDRGGSDRAARIAAALAREGRRIGTGDALTAGILLDHGVDTIVTRDTRHFARVPDLHVETY